MGSEKKTKALFIWRPGPGTRGTLSSRAEPSFPAIAYKSSSTVYMRNRKLGSGGRVTLGVGSLGWQDRVTLEGEPTRLARPSRATQSMCMLIFQSVERGNSS